MAKEIIKKTRVNQATYPVGDFLIKFKNAVMAKKHSIDYSFTKLVLALAHTLMKEGYLDTVQKEEGKISAKITYRKKEPLLMNINLISKPGLRVYMNVERLKEHKGPFKFIVSTSKGVMMEKDAVKKNLGGEIIAEVL